MLAKGKNYINLSCTCGCDNSLNIKVIDDSVFVTFTESTFYSKQISLKDIFVDKIKSIHNKINKKKYLYNEVMMTKEDFNDFIIVLKEIRDNLKDNDNKIDNDAYLKVEPIIIDGELYEYAIGVISKQNLKDTIFNEHRMYDLEFNKKTLSRFIKVCDKLNNEYKGENE